MDQQRAQNTLLSREQIIKPGQVPNLHFLTPQQKQQISVKVSVLWQKMSDFPQEHPEHTAAHRELSALSLNFKTRLNQFKQQSAQQQLANQQAMAQGQSNQMAMAHQAQQQMAVAQQAARTAPQPQNAFSDKVRNAVNAFKPVAPQEIKARGEGAVKEWTIMQRQIYAQHMSKWESTSRDYEAYRSKASAASKSMTPDQIEMAKAEINRLKGMLDITQRTAIQFKNSLDPVAAADFAKLQAQRQQAQQQAQLAQQNANQLKQEETSNNGQPVIKNEVEESGQSESHSVAPVRPPVVPNPQAQTSSAIPTGQPTPLSHQAALASARSYSTSAVPGHQSQNPQPMSRETTTPAAPSMTNSKTTNRTLNVPSPTPVPMHTSRPTLTGGTGPAGAMGQPALTRNPNVTLPQESEGRVLSRNRLYELIREVTGGAVGDEGVDPDVEEILLDVADEFVDDVCVAACQLAKVRFSNSLELRDLQAVVERNYNIRVPGFASDELRTVKRIIPTQAWAQKMSAVQAAKMNNGKGDA